MWKEEQVSRWAGSSQVAGRWERLGLLQAGGIGRV